VTVVDVARDFVEVTGPEAATFLQGQLSQDVSTLAQGQSAWSFVLQPSGKVDVLVRVLRTAADGFVLDTEAGWRDQLIARLQRFKLRTKADIAPLEWQCRWDFGTVADVTHAWRVCGWDGKPTAWVGAAPPIEPTAGSEEYESARIRHAWPAMGTELDEKTIPAETGILAATVSFTKGCYTGQELVARIDSRGNNPPRHLEVAHLDDESAALAPGDAITVDGHDIGRITSAVGAWGLGYIGRGHEAGGPVEIAGRAARLIERLAAD
jgi:folate-binding protein YgfZ